MSENGDTQNETTESENMDISEVSDVVSPASDHSLFEAVDNAVRQASTVTYMTCRSHPLDNARPTTSTTNSDVARERLDSTLSLDGLNLDLPTLDAYQEEYADFPSSPKQLKAAGSLAMPLEIASPSTAGACSDEEDDRSMYQAILSSDCKDVRLRKEEATEQALRRVLSPNPEDLILPFSEQKLIYEVGQPLEHLKKLAAPDPSLDADAADDRGFVFERRNSKRLSKRDAKSNGRVMEGLFVESPLSHTSRRRIAAPQSLQDFESPTKDGPESPESPRDEPDMGRIPRTNDIYVLPLEQTACSERITRPDITPQGRLRQAGRIPCVDDVSGRDEDEGDAEPRHFDVNVEINHNGTSADAARGEKDLLDRPGSLVANQRGGRRKIRVTAALLDDDDAHDDVSSDESQAGSDTNMAAVDDDDLDLDDLLGAELDSPDELEDSILERLGEAPEPIPELTAAEERTEARSWRPCSVGGMERRIDMKVIEPYKRVLSHGGYLSAGSHNAIIIFSACFLPDRSRVDYTYVMDNLFFYVLITLEQLVTEDYVLVYLHGATSRACMPTFSWLKRCYQMIDRRLRKNLKGLYLVHPTFWLKTIVLMTRPFVSTKFSRKLNFVETLTELRSILPLEQASIPERVKQLDDSLTVIDTNHKKKTEYIR